MPRRLTRPLKSGHEAGLLQSNMARSDPVSVLERWRDFGGDYLVLQLSNEGAIVELRSCFGEPVERPGIERSAPAPRRGRTGFAGSPGSQCPRREPTMLV